MRKVAALKRRWKSCSNLKKTAVNWGGGGARALPGQAVSGDMHLIKPMQDGVLIAVVDGLGHGDEATAAAEGWRLRTFVGAGAGAGDRAWCTGCNEALMATRGVVMTLAVIDAGEGHLDVGGGGKCGGVAGGGADPQAMYKTENVLQRGGVLGYQMPTLQASVIPIARGDLLIFATDGIRANFANTILKN